MSGLVAAFGELWPLLVVAAGVAFMARWVVKAKPYTCRRCGFDLSSRVSGPYDDPLGRHVGPYPAKCPRCGP